MLGPNAFEGRSRPRETAGDGWTWGEDEGTDTAETCELCRSETSTSVEYGLRVCARCEEDLLP